MSRAGCCWKLLVGHAKLWAVKPYTVRPVLTSGHQAGGEYGSFVREMNIHPWRALDSEYGAYATSRLCLFPCKLVTS
jgi:hypothetical protein